MIAVRMRVRDDQRLRATSERTVSRSVVVFVAPVSSIVALYAWTCSSGSVFVAQLGEPAAGSCRVRSR
jgi:hypothetical protein